VATIVVAVSTKALVMWQKLRLRPVFLKHLKPELDSLLTIGFYDVCVFLILIVF